jgi:predicted DsbA family dithiol-disulfide isomerase
VKVEIYSDVVCPWCYIGERRLTRALEAFAQRGHVDVVFRPYQLDPTAPSEAVPLAEYVQRRFGGRFDHMLDRVTAMAKGEDIAIAWDKALSVNTRTAHRLLMWAQSEYGAGVQRALMEKLFDLYFTKGANVADVDQLAEAAAEVGVDRDRAREYLQSDRGVQELEAEFDKARRLGIQAVPTFVVDGRYVVEGAQPVDAFVDVLEQAIKNETTH